MKYNHNLARFFLTAFALAAICCFSIGAKADQDEEFLAALVAQNFEEATRIFDQHNVNPNYIGEREGSRGFTPMLVAAMRQQWPLVTRMLDRAGDVNATPEQGPHQGRTPFFYAVAFGHWPLAHRMLDLGANVNTAAREGAESRATALYFAAIRKQWPFVARILLTRPESNLDLIPAEGLPLETVLKLHGTPRWVLSLFVLLKYIDPERQREASHSFIYDLSPWRLTFDRALRAFLDSTEQVTTVSALPPEMRWKLAEDSIFVQLPELNEVPVELKLYLVKLLRRILKHSQDSFVPAQLTDAQILSAGACKVVASRVLENLYPIATRDERKKNTVIKVHEWIVELLSRQLSKRVLKKPDRDRLVAILSLQPLNKIRRKWINQEILYFFHQQDAPEARVEAPHVETKRARKEVHEGSHDLSTLKIRIRRPKVEATPDANLREGLVRDVIRDAPGLDLDQVNERVDEIMGEGVQPMDIDNETAPANFTNVENTLNPYGLLRIAFQ